jgi:putative iron-regulated protein
VRRILTGAVVVTAFELGGERLTVAYDTQDQEQEHSCFSDTTWFDFVANQEGLCAVLIGVEADGKQLPGLLVLVRAIDAKLADLVEKRLHATAACLRAIPQPFDQAMLCGDDRPGRVAIRRAIEAMEAQTEALLIVGKRLGHDLPLSPGG